MSHSAVEPRYTFLSFLSFFFLLVSCVLSVGTAAGMGNGWWSLIHKPNKNFGSD